MAKEQYTRQNIASKMLKTVIIRFDFIGATNIKEFVDSMKRKSFFANGFKSFLPLEHKNFTLSINPNQIPTGSLPISEQSTDSIFRFTNCTLDENSNAILDIDSKSICLTIDCREFYSGSKPYTEFMAQLFNEFKGFDSYITVKRIGIRKIDAQTVDNLSDLNSYFENNMPILQGLTPELPIICRSYTDIQKRDIVTYNILQRIDFFNNKIRVIIDTDGYIQNGDISHLSTQEDFCDLLNQKMNDVMFDVFKNFVTENYLEQCKIQ